MAEVAQRREKLTAWLGLITALLGLACGLRLYRLDAMPLRGDEAFAIEHWAAPPREIVRDLAQTEPHPFGTFFGFWAWKRVAGESVFAMRTLPLLANLLGVAAVAALGRRLFRSDRVALLAAVLWAINPFQIWHAQDARNYAIWASLSPLTMWLFLRAADSRRPRDWGWYLLAEAAALYVFFFEALFLPVQAIYLLIFRRSRPVLRRALMTWIILGVLMIPWCVHLWHIAHSGYEGNTERAAPAKLFTWFLPTLLSGEETSISTVNLLAWCVLVALALLANRCYDFRLEPQIGWLLVYILIPAALLLIVATQSSVFHPRYLIAAAPALLLIVTAAVPLTPKQHYSPSNPFHYRPFRSIAWIVLLSVPLVGLATLEDYYHGRYPKSPDWPSLASFLEYRTRPGQRIVKTFIDPAFNYYYRGPATETSLTPGADIPASLRPEINFADTIWLIGHSPEAESYLSDHMQTLSTGQIAAFPITQYRRWETDPGEIDAPSGARFGDIVRLAGYALQGPDPAHPAITLLLYWEPLAQADIDYKVFVHLVAPDGTIQSQDDHPPLANTTAWEPGALLRDPFHLLKSPAPTPPPGDYTIQVGFYDPATNNRLPVFDADGVSLGDSIPLAVLRWPVR